MAKGANKKLSTNANSKQKIAVPNQSRDQQKKNFKQSKKSNSDSQKKKSKRKLTRTDKLVKDSQ